MSITASVPEIQQIKECPKIMSLPSEIFDEVFRHLKFDKRSLYSCLLVNRFWCRKVVPLIWRRPMPYNRKKNNNHVDVGVFIPYFNEDERIGIIKGGITIPDRPRPFFNYAQFLHILDIEGIEKAAKDWLAKVAKGKQGANSDTTRSDEIIVTNITIDRMSENSTTNAMVASLLKMFMRCAINLKYLVLNPFGGYRDIPDSKIFIEGRPGLTNLRKFKIRFNSLSVIRPEHRKNIFELLNALPNVCTGIHHLDITRVRVSNPDVARMVGGVIRSQQQLFYCRFCRIDGDVDSLISMLRYQVNNLITVVFDDTDLDGVSLEPLAQCVKLEALIFRKCRNVNLEKWQILINAPFKLKLLHLSDLNDLDPDVTKAIIEKAGDNLEKIGIEMRVVPSNLEGLEAIMSNCPNVMHFSMKCMQSHIDIKTIVPIIDKFQSLTHLTILLGGQRAGTYESLVELSKINFLRLQYLELTCSDLSIEGLNFFLENCESPLTTLIIDSISEEDLEIFKKFSRERGTLKWLGVEHSKPEETPMSHYDFLKKITNLAEGLFQAFPARQLRVREKYM
ncbi:12585_t:CDS:1 [Acaulospora morrowiae]|uniref:12585_t:CDS:1 n=1 Tax=Acaulospora morrowiae TaxID=94023 RepID=A0A9N8ZUK2_9GLOM|nr:12585_t:CDS:1 [Acaulospora morrowiae]